MLVRSRRAPFERFAVAFCGLMFLCGDWGSLPAIQAATETVPLRITVIGDSISKLQILPGSAVPCGVPTNGVIPCKYSTDGSKSYPALIAVQTGDIVTNLASPGARTVENSPGTIAVINQVPSIPKNSNVVIVESGTNDTSAHGASPQYLADISKVVSAVHARVPGARMIFIGVRYFWQVSSINDRVNLWDADLRLQNGTFIDTRQQWPPGVNVDWPDGTHPGPGAVRALARDIESTLKGS